MKYLNPSVKQQGVVLIVAMVMLVIMSLLGISSVRSVALEERMSASMHDRSIAMQAAEAALLAGEQDARAKTGFPANFDPEATFTNDPQAVVNGFVARPTTLPSDWMLALSDAEWQQSSRELSSNADLGYLAGTRPRYLIEYQGMAVCKSQNSGEAATQDCNTSEGKLSPTCNCYLFRITARSNPGQGRAEVILQSLFTTF